MYIWDATHPPVVLLLSSGSDGALRCGTLLDLHRGLVIVVIIIVFIVLHWKREEKLSHFINS